MWAQTNECQIQVTCIFLSPMTLAETPVLRISVRCLYLAGSIQAARAYTSLVLN